MVLLITVAVLIPRVGGATPYAILTSSMVPTAPPGTLVVVRPVDPAEINVGDVITYQLASGQPAVVTHRVIAVTSDGKGGPAFRTQGDANRVADEGEVIPVQIKGRLWYSVPYVGRLHVAVDQNKRNTMVTGVAVVLLGYASFMFATAARGRRRPAGAPDDDAEPVLEDAGARP
ncbi:signal peptidase I [Nocardioides sp. MJB4]|uniref:Signal peptidase I n=2 Tax=Nocardioides donggukensis TaxID=2774019 RepID=A0A927Q265_9ACTN|nr:signal peptidase I [Nocardioides donggukensis]